MNIHITAADADFERAPAMGSLSIALTPYLEERVIRRTAFGTLVDLHSVPRFGLRRRLGGEEYRIVGRDGGKTGSVVEIRI